MVDDVQMKNLLLIFLFLGIFISSQTYHAKVVGVHDGDTVYVLDSLNVNHKIRIESSVGKGTRVILDLTHFEGRIE
mgnify:CR=1 FL=1